MIMPVTVPSRAESRYNVFPSREILDDGGGCPNVPAAKAVPPPPASSAAEARLLCTN